MNYRFALTDKENLVLVGDDKIIQKVEKIAGYELVKMKVADDMIDSLSDSLLSKGISVNTATKIESTAIKPVVKKGIYSMVYLINSIIGLAMVVAYFMGIVLATGWMKVVALFPLYSYYLVVEFFMKHYGMIV